jgi:hypothetical protein
MYSSLIDIEFDSPEAGANQSKSDVSFGHTEQALCGKCVLAIHDPEHHDKQHFLAFGTDANLRVFPICHEQCG